MELSFLYCLSGIYSWLFTCWFFRFANASTQPPWVIYETVATPYWQHFTNKSTTSQVMLPRDDDKWRLEYVQIGVTHYNQHFIFKFNFCCYILTVIFSFLNENLFVNQKWCHTFHSFSIWKLIIIIKKGFNISYEVARIFLMIIYYCLVISPQPFNVEYNYMFRWCWFKAWLLMMCRSF